jgi:ribosome-associated protein
VIDAALDKKATDVVVLDLRGTPAFTDFFILCSGQNQRQVKAIAEQQTSLKALKMRPNHIEECERAEWVLIGASISSCTSSISRRTFYALSDCEAARSDRGGDSVGRALDLGLGLDR